jgi:hypothetical protein
MPKKIHRRRDADPEEGLEKYGGRDLRRLGEQEVPDRHARADQAAWAYILQPRNAEKYTAGEVRTIKARVRAAAKARRVALPDPDEFVELMDRARKKEPPSPLVRPTGQGE